MVANWGPGPGRSAPDPSGGRWAWDWEPWATLPYLVGSQMPRLPIHGPLSCSTSVKTAVVGPDVSTLPVIVP